MGPFCASVALILVFGALHFATDARAAGQETVDSGVDRLLRGEAQQISSWSLVPEILNAVRERNANQMSMKKIRSIDLGWIYATRETSRMRLLMANPCAEKLKVLVAGNPSYREAMVMDNLGALVCMSRRTSDYWQGDEDKWIRAFNEGEGAVFIDEPEYDESVKAILVQISTPILVDERAIGVVTVGLDASELVRERRR